MLVALAAYLKGLSHLPDEPHLIRNAAPPAKLNTADWRSVGLLIVMLMMTVILTLGFDQIFNMGMVWIDAAVDLETPFGPMPVAWFVSINSLGVVLGAIATLAWWRWQAKHGREPENTTKIAIGGLLAGVGVMLLAAGSAAQAPGRVSIAVPVIAYFLSGVGFTWFWPTWLAVISRYAPRQIAARMMAAAYLVVFLSNLVGGYVATLYETMEPTLFWSLNAATCVLGSALFFAFGPMLTRALAERAAPQPIAALA